jgi:hypothetical protein
MSGRCGGYVDWLGLWQPDPPASPSPPGSLTIPSREPRRTLAGPSPDPRRTLTVDKAFIYGEGPARLRRDSGVATRGGGYFTRSPQNSAEPEPAAEVPQPQRLVEQRVAWLDYPAIPNSFFASAHEINGLPWLRAMASFRSRRSSRSSTRWRNRFNSACKVRRLIRGPLAGCVVATLFVIEPEARRVYGHPQAGMCPRPGGCSCSRCLARVAGKRRFRVQSHPKAPASAAGKPAPITALPHIGALRAVR